MSKLFCTLAWYHDSGTMKPQLILSCNPSTNLVVKGSDWKGARFGNMNSTVGSRDRFEYSFTGGKTVTRASAVMNVSTILPPLLWLSSHPTGAPTAKGPRGDPKWKIAEEAKRVHEAKQKGIEYIPDDDPEKPLKQRIKERDKSRAASLREDRYLEDRPSDRDYFPPRTRHQFTNMENRSYDFTEEVTPFTRGPRRGVPDADQRRMERRERLRASAVPLPSRSYSDPEPRYVPTQYDDYVDLETRRALRQSRMRSSSSPEAARYRRSRRRYDGRGGDEAAPDGEVPVHGGDGGGHGGHGGHGGDGGGHGGDGGGGGGE